MNVLMEQQKNLMYALKAKNIIFSDDLVYTNCPPTCNNAAL